METSQLVYNKKYTVCRIKKTTHVKTNICDYAIITVDNISHDVCCLFPMTDN